MIDSREVATRDAGFDRAEASALYLTAISLAPRTKILTLIDSKISFNLLINLLNLAYPDFPQPIISVGFALFKFYRYRSRQIY